MSGCAVTRLERFSPLVGSARGNDLGLSQSSQRVVSVGSQDAPSSSAAALGLVF